MSEAVTANPNNLMACRHCGLVLEAVEAPVGNAVKCPRCDTTLYSRSREGFDYAIALHLTGVILFIAANAFPFIAFEMEGRQQRSRLATGVYEFLDQGFWFLGFLVALVTLVVPLAKLVGMLYVLLPLKFGRVTPYAAQVFRWMEEFRPWSMMEVFLIGIIVAYVKLIDFATVELGPSVYAFCALIVILAAGEAAIESREIWKRLGPGQGRCGQSEGEQLIACHVCDFLLTDAVEGEHEPHCLRCDAHLHHRKKNSMSRTAALVIAAAFLYVPANVFPVMTVISFGKGEPDTIISGVISLLEANMWPLALIIFVASVTVPLLKLFGLGYLMISVAQGSRWRPRDRTFLYRVIDAVGRWSMIDVFMIAILIALVRLGKIASVSPGFGATSFAAVVVLTMFASHTFDSRLIWDRMREDDS